MNIFNFYISRTDRDIDMGRKAFSKTYFSSVVSDDLNWKKQLINIRASMLASSCLYCTNEFWQMDSVWACIRSSMKLDNSRESWGGKHRQDRSPGSYPAHLHLHPAKKRGESDRRSTVTRSLWAIVRARRCYHSPWALRLDGGGGTPQRGQSLRSRWIFNGIAEGIKKGGGKGGRRSRMEEKAERKRYNYTYNGSIRSNFHISIVSREGDPTSFAGSKRLPAQAISYSCNIELLLFYHRLDLIRGKFHL